MNKYGYSDNVTKLATMGQARERYKLSRYMIKKICEECDAIRKIGKCVRVDVEVLDEYLGKM